MFIELTDHLRCPEDHQEQFLVLLPDQVDRRRVVRGSLGCPVCGRVFEVTAGIARFAPVDRGGATTGLSAGAAVALMGIGGPGGYVALVGSAGRLGAELGALIPHVHFALVNPPEGIEETPATSIFESARVPLKTASMRSVVVGADLGGVRDWVEDAARVVLPGNRLVVEGEPIDTTTVEVLASAPGAWVGRRMT